MVLFGQETLQQDGQGTRLGYFRGTCIGLQEGAEIKASLSGTSGSLQDKLQTQIEMGEGFGHSAGSVARMPGIEHRIQPD